MRGHGLTVRGAAFVFLGGAVGTAVRALLLLPESETWQLIGVPVVNIAGAFLLGVVTGALALRPATERVRSMRLLLGTGVLGGFTTYSALAVQATGGWWVAVAIATVILGTAAASIGLVLGRRVSRSGWGRGA